MAAHIDPMRVRLRHQWLHHFAVESGWSYEQMLLRVCQRAVAKMDFAGGGRWIIDDAGFPKQGRHSVGVARQYCGMRGKQESRRVAVSVSLACETASVPVAWGSRENGLQRGPSGFGSIVYEPLVAGDVCRMHRKKNQYELR